MTLLSLLFILPGVALLGFSFLSWRRGWVKLYDRKKGKIVCYEGASLLYIVGGMGVAAGGFLVVGVFGFQYLVVGIVAALAFFVARGLAEQSIQ